MNTRHSQENLISETLSTKNTKDNNRIARTNETYRTSVIMYTEIKKKIKNNMIRKTRLDGTSRTSEKARTFVTQKTLCKINTKRTNNYNNRITRTIKTCRTITENSILSKRISPNYDINKNIKTLHIYGTLKTIETFGTL